MPREQQQIPNVHRSNPIWELTTVEANQLHDTTPTSLPPLQPAQCPFEKWEIFMPHPVFALRTVNVMLRVMWDNMWQNTTDGIK